MKATATYAYYPGCTLKTTAKEFDVSTRLVCEALGIRLLEIPGWICCGASSAHETDHLLALSMAAREIAGASEMGWPLVASCAMCFSRVKMAAAELADPAIRGRVSGIVGRQLPASYEVLHLLQVIDGRRDTLPVTRPLSDLKVACYYGCVLVRPPDIARLDDVENPQIMDRIVRAAGAEPVPWAFKTECCGAALALPKSDIMLKLVGRILQQAKQAGADCVAVACPLCHSNLDSYQKDVNTRLGEKVGMPVLYFTELLGLCIGATHERLHLDKHFADPLPLLRAKGIVKERSGA